jgi:hypothetical protein
VGSGPTRSTPHRARGQTGATASSAMAGRRLIRLMRWQVSQWHTSSWALDSAVGQ